MTDKTVVVIGAGFSGIAVAVQLLRQLRQPARVCLVNRTHRFGRGMAYGTRSGSHLLNVPAGRMGLFPEEEDGFLLFLQRQGLAYRGADFVPRKLYGDYLEAALESAAAAAAPGVVLELVQAEVRRLQPEPTGATLQLDDGRVLRADEVVLALGNLPPRLPLALAGVGRGVVNDPWSPAALDALPADARVLLVGSGLTAFDVVLSLLDRGHQGPITMVSRRGLLPQPHRSLESPPAADLLSLDLLAPGLGLRQRLHLFRNQVRIAQARGHDWRDVVGALRPHTPRLWEQLDERARRQFLRHLLPYWDTHRHRAAPQIHARVLEALRSGRLQAVAARIEAAAAGEAGVELRWRERGAAASRVGSFDLVVNCTGPCSDLRHSGEALVGDMRAAGLLVPDSLGLGLQVSEDHAMAATQAQPGPAVRYVGPLLKARWWEATAVPELRLHARDVAAGVARRLAAEPSHQRDREAVAG